jgi:hypothetical protein
MTQIDLACGPYRIVELGRKPGNQATAIVKSDNVIVESRRPAGVETGPLRPA